MIHVVILLIMVAISLQNLSYERFTSYPPSHQEVFRSVKLVKYFRSSDQVLNMYNIADVIIVLEVDPLILCNWRERSRHLN